MGSRKNVHGPLTNLLMPMGIVSADLGLHNKNVSLNKCLSYGTSFKNRTLGQRAS